MIHRVVQFALRQRALVLLLVVIIGVGGVIMQFRLGPLSYDDVVQSLTLFMRKVAPELAS